VGRSACPFRYVGVTRPWFQSRWTGSPCPAVSLILTPAVKIPAIGAGEDGDIFVSVLGPDPTTPIARSRSRHGPKRGPLPAAEHDAVAV